MPIRRIADLQRLDLTLRSVIDACQPARMPECPFLEALSQKAELEKVSASGRRLGCRRLHRLSKVERNLSRFI